MMPDAVSRGRKQTSGTIIYFSLRGYRYRLCFPKHNLSIPSIHPDRVPLSELTLQQRQR
jgi:hypothetical protein